MKALEILKKLSDKKTGYATQKEKDETRSFYREAIKELEELNNRSCYECKHWCQEFQSIGICCKGVKEEKHFRETMTYSNFYCRHCEPKQ